MASVTVVGGGIAGLAAARTALALGHRVSVREAADRCGGKLVTGSVGGVAVDLGAESFLVRVPEARELAAALGLTVLHPVTGSAALVVGGRLRPIPAGTVLGVPTRLRGLVPVLGLPGLLRATADLVLPASAGLGDDPSVGALVSARLGTRVRDRLVDPLLGGVYAGGAAGLSVRMTAPVLADPGRSLLRTARDRRPPERAGPVFGTVSGGLGLLIDTMVDELVAGGAVVRTGAPVRSIEPVAGGWQVDGEPADGVVLAVPGARLLAPLLPGRPVLDPPYASVAIVTLALSDPPPVPGSGFLVAAGERRVIKAATLISAKWGRPGPVLVRASVGRYGETAALAHPDVELAGIAAAEIGAITGWRGSVLDWQVTRWDPALPQYPPGYGAAVARLRAELAAARLPGGLALAGAAYDGVGIPACIRSGTRAARELFAGPAPLGVGH